MCVIIYTGSSKSACVPVKTEQIVYSICPTINGAGLCKCMPLVNLLVELGQGQRMTGEVVDCSIACIIN